MASLKRLQNVLDRVRKNFKYTSDILRHGVLEKWTYPDTEYDGTTELVGDCEDFALAVRKLLLDRKIPSRLVLCLTEHRERHIVVEVEGWILDNRLQKVTSRDNLKYQWVAISGWYPGEDWHKL